MKAKSILINLLVTTACVVTLGQKADKKFVTPIDAVPFARIARPHEIDFRCPATGREDDNTYHYAQNTAKNNLAAKGAPVPLQFSDFTRLQQESQRQIDSGEIPLEGKYPRNRVQLHSLINVRGTPVGEGSVVSLRAYIFNANYANTKYKTNSDGTPGKGEAVDCDNPELDWNDIHVALSETPDGATDECTTVTAELIPHYRPAAWDRFHDGTIDEIEKLVPGILKGRVVENPDKHSRPVQVRVTGQLFYDASHRPCVFRDGKVVERHGPERRSIWEIHPVYRIEIYDQKRRNWVDLDRWMSSEQ